MTAVKRASRSRLLAASLVAGSVCTLVWPFFQAAPADYSSSAVDLAFLARGSTEDPVVRAKRVLVESDAVFFDVDSTVVATEGIDLIGKCFGVMKEISELTHQAMNGNVKFQDAMAQRLQLLSQHGMTKDTLEKCVDTEGKPRWSPDVQEVVQRFHEMGKDVYLVSGGFRNMIKPIAEALGIPDDRVYANTILFDADGKYSGFDRKAPTSRSGGKPAVLKMLQKSNGYTTMIMFGDGATDMDARTNGPAAAFIGYGGVQERKKVKEGADWFIYGFKEILDILPAT